MKLLKALTILLTSVLASVSFECQAQENNYPFTVAPVYPENQVESGAGYWYMDAAAGKIQVLEASVGNISGKGITVYVEPADCFTSTGGDLCYITGNTSPLVSLTDERFMLAKKMSIPVKSLELAAGETRTLRFTVTAPTVDAGEVLGGVRFYVTTSGQNTEKMPGGGNAQLNLNIRNAITITVRLRYKPFESMGNATFTIGDAGFDADYGSLFFSITNLLPQINRDVRGSYDVYDNSGNRLLGGSFDMVRMAPVSEVRLPVKWDYPYAEPGDYSIAVKTGNSSKPEVRTFKLGSGDAGIIIETEAPPGSAPQPPGTAAEKLLEYGGWIMFVVTFIFLIVFLLTRRKKHDESENNRSQ